MNGAEILRQAAYEEGYKAGVTATRDALRKGIEEFLSDETDVIISEGEVFVPISALRKIVRKLEVHHGN